MFKKVFMYSHLNEPHLMKKLNKYELGIKLISSFKDYDKIYLVTTYFEGKTLDFYKDTFLDENKIKFISACIIQSFIYFRKENIIHRDINFKNIIMDIDKYFNIIDFSCSINYVSKNRRQYYLNNDVNVVPPEIFHHKKYYFNSDYYRFGSIIYYLIFKNYPNLIKNERNITHIIIDYKTIDNYSHNCIDFLNKLIVEDPIKRIGYNDVNELKNHPWFDNFQWKKLEKKEIKSPFSFINGSNKNHICRKFKKTDIMIKLYKIVSKTATFEKMIKNYEFADISMLIDKKN